jgi:hypothetical protein
MSNTNDSDKKAADGAVLDDSGSDSGTNGAGHHVGVAVDEQNKKKEDQAPGTPNQ